MRRIYRRLQDELRFVHFLLARLKVYLAKDGPPFLAKQIALQQATPPEVTEEKFPSVLKLKFYIVTTP